MKPNLFAYATSELSQDAILCWLLEWSDNNYASVDSHLHQIGKQFVKLIIGSHNHQFPDVYSVKIERQHKGVDVYCRINDEWDIVIEDKAGTTEHSNQLERYKKLFPESNSMGKLILVYIQTGNQSSYLEASNLGYSVIQRTDILKLLDSEIDTMAKASSDILDDYFVHLHGIESDTNAFSTRKTTKWEYTQWQGFYLTLQRRFPEANWGYVSNKRGGFCAFWWHHRNFPNFDLYLQVEQDSYGIGKLCFKIAVDEEIFFDYSSRKNIRDKIYNLIISEGASLGLKVTKPARWGNGKYMTVAVFSGEFPATKNDYLVDLEANVAIMKLAQQVIDSLIANY